MIERDRAYLEIAAIHRREATAWQTLGKTVNDTGTAIRELTARADLARKEGRPEDAAESDQSDASGYREELASRTVGASFPFSEPQSDRR